LGFSSKCKRWLKAGSLLKQGFSAVRVSQELGLSPKTVRRLKRDPRIYSPELASKSRYRGRPCQMDKDQQNRARLALIGKFSLDEHSISRAQRIIKEVSGIEYSTVHVRRLIKRLKAELPKGALYGHYNHKKRRCKCGALLVKRTCLLCLIQEIQDAEK